MNRICVLAALATLSLPVFAHHQFSSEYDRSKSLTLTGTITRVEWQEPHTTFYLDSKNPNGIAEQWKLEGASPSTLKQRGWTEDMMQEGSRVTFNAYQALDGSMLASARSVTMPGGGKVSVSDSAEDGGPALPSNISMSPQRTQSGAISQNSSDQT